MSTLDRKEWTKFSIQVVEKSVMVSHVDYGHYDLGQELVFGDDLSRAMESHAPTMAWWATLVSEERLRKRRFEDGPYARYMAHVRQYAKLVLKGLGDKDTLEAVRDLVILMFSQHRDPDTSDLVQAAHQGQLLNQFGTATAVRKYQEGLTVEQRTEALDKFRTKMYWYETEGAQYEDMVELLRDIERNVEILDAIVQAIHQRGIMLNSVASDRRSERTGLSTNSIKLIADQVQALIAQK